MDVDLVGAQQPLGFAAQRAVHRHGRDKLAHLVDAIQAFGQNCAKQVEFRTRVECDAALYFLHGVHKIAVIRKGGRAHIEVVDRFFAVDQTAQVRAALCATRNIR